MLEIMAFNIPIFSIELGSNIDEYGNTPFLPYFNSSLCGKICVIDDGIFTNSKGENIDMELNKVIHDCFEEFIGHLRGYSPREYVETTFDPCKYVDGLLDMATDVL